MKKERKKDPIKKPYGYTITKSRMRAAIIGSGGLKTVIAERLGVTWSVVNDVLKRKGWEDIRTVWEEEMEAVGDHAENAIQHAITQRLDIQQATLNARWYLGLRHRHRGFAEQSKIVVEGGKNPIKIEQSLVDLDKLDLPLEVRKVLLAAIEKETKEKDEMGDGSEINKEDG